MTAPNLYFGEALKHGEDRLGKLLPSWSVDVWTIGSTHHAVPFLADLSQCERTIRTTPEGIEPLAFRFP
jgi:hypothetical protein